MFSIGLAKGTLSLRSLRSEAIRGLAHRTWCFAETMCQLGFGRAARAGIRRAIAIRPAMIADPKVAALWMATWIGYKRFSQLQLMEAALLKMPAGTWNGRSSSSVICNDLRNAEKRVASCAFSVKNAD